MTYCYAHTLLIFIQPVYLGSAQATNTTIHLNGHVSNRECPFLSPFQSQSVRNVIDCCCCLLLLTDLSKNKLSELPTEVTRFSSLEKLNLYHNVIRFIPETVMYLQCLTYLDIRCVTVNFWIGSLQILVNQLFPLFVLVGTS